MTWDQWLSVAAAVFAAGAFLAAIVLFRKLSPTTRTEHGADDDGAADNPTRRRSGTRLLRAAFVANPTKNDMDRIHAEVDRISAELGWAPPLWLETTKEDPGTGQANMALQQGVDIVVAAGGDGTVRAVAKAMAGSGVPMGLLAVGTGNLLARNLDLPVANIDALIRATLTGNDHPIDMGWVDAVRADGTVSRSHPFLVIAGMGFDAQMVNDTSDWLKARIGWFAYFMAGIRHLHGQRIRVRIQIDKTPAVNSKVRSVLIGNCGRLPGNLTLIPEAKVDDGWLDLVAVDPRGGLVGWSVLTGEILTQGIDRRAAERSKLTMDHLRGRTMTIESDEAHVVELDGDIIGKAKRLHVRVDPSALIVRTPYDSVEPYR